MPRTGAVRLYGEDRRCGIGVRSSFIQTFSVERHIERLDPVSLGGEIIVEELGKLRRAVSNRIHAVLVERIGLELWILQDRGRIARDLGDDVGRHLRRADQGKQVVVDRVLVAFLEDGWHIGQLLHAPIGGHGQCPHAMGLEVLDDARIRPGHEVDLPRQQCLQAGCRTRVRHVQKLHVAGLLSGPVHRQVRRRTYPSRSVRHTAGLGLRGIDQLFNALDRAVGLHYVDKRPDEELRDGLEIACGNIGQLDEKELISL